MVSPGCGGLKLALPFSMLAAIETALAFVMLMGVVLRPLGLVENDA